MVIPRQFVLTRASVHVLAAVSLATTASACDDAARGEISIPSGRVVVVGSPELTPGLGARRVAADGHAATMELLRSPERTCDVSNVFTHFGGSSIAVDPSHAGPANTCLGAMTSLRAPRGTRATWLAPRLALYEAFEIPNLPERRRAPLAHVIHEMLRGVQPPQIESFPADMRESADVEVLLGLREGRELRLWRSARASSIAEAAVLAATVARSRWNERATTLGGTLDSRLPHLDVELSLLVEDGTFGERGGVFVGNALGPQHGLGFEERGEWHYLLPEHLAAFPPGERVRALFAKEPPKTDPTGAALRLYRFLVVPIVVTPARHPTDAGVAAAPSTSR